jgi:hypothetical protein
VKSEHYTGESHNKHGGADGTEPMRISGKMCGSPIDEGRHPSTLDAYCECYQNRGGAGLAKKVHCSSHCWPAKLEAIVVSKPITNKTTFLPALGENVHFRMLTAVRGRRLPLCRNQIKTARQGIPPPSLRR